MPTASIHIPVTDLRQKPIDGPLTIELRRDQGSYGAGGGNFDYTATLNGQTIVTLTDIPTLGGAGTRYRIAISAPGYLRSSFFQSMREGERDAMQHTYLVRDPRYVAGIDAPSYSGLPWRFRRWLDHARMVELEPEDGDLVGLSGRALYQALGDERRAGLLNIFAKATHVDTVGAIWRHFGGPMVIRRDRCFVEVSEALIAYVAGHRRYDTAPRRLHNPLPTYSLLDSVKSDDPHANIQLTFQYSTADGSIAADVDIDEYSGFPHWGEVLRNHFTRQRTNPYAIHQLLLAANLSRRGWDYPIEPGYELRPLT
jgi:hypothetical protein